MLKFRSPNDTIALKECKSSDAASVINLQSEARFSRRFRLLQDDREREASQYRSPSTGQEAPSHGRVAGSKRLFVVINDKDVHFCAPLKGGKVGLANVVKACRACGVRHTL